jgi:methylmalonyl-CoA mutase C-terminal domain/subunit
MREFMARLQKASLNHVLVIIGGIIHPQEIPQLEEMGVAGVFLPGTNSKDIAEFVSGEVKKRKQLQSSPPS